MKPIFWIITLLGGMLISCNKDVTPEIPVIYEYDLTVVDQSEVPVSNATVNVYMPHKPDFVVMSKNTDIFGKVHFLNLKAQEYIFEAKLDDIELFKTSVTVTDDNTKNVSTIASSTYQVIISDLQVIVKTDKGKAIAERKVDLLTEKEGILYRSGTTDENGMVTFDKLPIEKYKINVYDELNQTILKTEHIELQEDVTKNVSQVQIVKLIHNSDIVITGMMVDPKGTDCPKKGQVSGGGVAHLGGYEYIQLLALKDINFDTTPYCIITGMNATNPNDATYPAAVNGWVQSMGGSSKTTYQMNLTSGSVKKGQFFYVGGYSRAIASYYNNWVSVTVEPDRWWAFDFYYKPGDNGNGAAKGGSGIFNNLNGDKITNVPDGVAIFKGINIDKNSIPQDCVFYGGASPIRKEDRYLITDNDLYSTVNASGEPQPYFGDGTNTWFAKQGFHDDGCYFMMGGSVSPTEWVKPRTGKAIRLNCAKGANSVSISDIESSEGVTKFIDE